MNKKNPLVSIIVRTKDRPKLLEKALKSIAAQTHRPIEVVLVNDGGCDLDIGTLGNILKDVALNYIRLEKNTGRAHAGNVGIENAKGKYIGFLDDDDELYSDHVAILIAVLEEYYDTYKVAYSDANIAYLSFDPEKREMATRDKRLFSSKDFSYSELIVDNYIPLMCILFSAEILEQVKGLDERFDIYEDWDMLIRIAENHPFYHVPRITAEYIQWSSTFQIAQTPEFVDKSHAAHIQIINKHREKITPEIVRELVLKKRALKERENTIATLEEVRTNLESALREKEGIITTLGEVRTNLERSLHERESTITTLGEVRTNLEQVLQEKEGMIADLERSRERLEGVLGEREHTVSALEEVRASFEKALTEKEQTINDLEGVKESLESALKEREKTITNFEGVKESLERALQEKENTISNLEEIRASFEQVLQEKEKMITSLEGMKASFEGAAREKANVTDNLEGVRANFERIIQEKEGALLTLEKVRTNFEKALQDQENTIASLEEVKATFERALQDKENTITNLKGVRTSFERALQEKEEMITDLKGVRANLEKVIHEKDEVISRLEGVRTNLNASLGGKEYTIADLEGVKANLERALHDKEGTIGNLEGVRTSLERVLQEKERMIGNLEGVRTSFERALQEKECTISDLKEKEFTLNQIFNSHGWKVLSFYYNMRDRLFPTNSKRRLFYELMLITMENPRAAFKSLDRYNIKRFLQQYKILDPTVIESKVKRKISLSSFNNGKPVPEAPFMGEDTFGKNGSVFPGAGKKDHVLVIDRFVPTYDKDSGSLRMYTFLQILIDLGYNVTFLPDDLQKREPYVEELQRMGIEVLYGNMNVEKYLENMGNVFTFVILSRPEQAFKYVSLVRAYAVNSSIIYDTVDLHWLRFERAAAISGNREFFDKARHYKSMELFNASCSDLVLTVTADEKEFLLRENPDLKIEVVPNIHDVKKTVKPFAGRKDIMFIGGFLHQPNEDAVFYFVKEIFPLLRKRVPDMKFYVVGSDPSESLLKLDAEDVKVTGYVKDIMPYFEDCRVFVSPLRYGAGMKGKIGQSMGYGLPVVTTVIGAEGIGLIDGENALIADKPEDFADSIIRLYTDEKLWNKLSANSLEHIEKCYSREVVGRKITELLNAYRYLEV